MRGIMRAAVVVVALAAVLLGCAEAAFEDYYDLADYENNDYGWTTTAPDCITDGDGKDVLNGTACTLEVKGDDMAVHHPGGFTGIYRFDKCQNGRPSYKRDKVEGEKATMYMAYSMYWGDWDFCNASTLSDESVLGYGGEGFGELRPEDVLPEDWYVLKDLVANQSSPDDFVAVPTLVVRCQVEQERSKADGNCSDAIMNGAETGVDCGGNCRPCVQYSDQKAAVQALKEKLRLEWEEKQRESRMTGVAKASIIVIAVLASAIVCGGPLIYLCRALRGDKKGAQYAQLPVLSRPKAAAK